MNDTTASTTTNTKNRVPETLTTEAVAAAAPPPPPPPRRSRKQKNATTKTIEKIYYVMVRIHNHKQPDCNPSIHHQNYSSNNVNPSNRQVTMNGIHDQQDPYSIVGQWHILQGIMLPPLPSSSHKNSNDHTNKGWSVRMIQPTAQYQPQQTGSSKEKLCSLQFRIIFTYPKNGRNTNGNMNENNHIEKNNNNNGTIRLLQIRTRQGSRHMIRAILSCHHMPILGDVRYADQETLPDQSVALHAYSLKLHKSVVDRTRKSKSSLSSKIDPQQEEPHGHMTGSNNNENDRAVTIVDHIDTTDDEYHYWKAPIPKTWEKYFHCTQSMIDSWEEQFPVTV